MKNPESATMVRPNLWRLMLVIGGLSLFLLSYNQYVNTIITEEENAARIAAEEKEKMNIQWNLYKNSEYGFSLKYPLPMGEPSIYASHWSSDIASVRDLPYMIQFRNYNSEENPYMRAIQAEMNIYPANNFDKTLREFMYEDFFGNKLDLPLGDPVSVMVGNNVTGYEFSTAAMSKYLGFVHGNYIYVFGSDNVNTDVGNKVYDEMAKSIQLFEPITDSNNEGNDSDDDKEDDDNDNERDESDK